MYRVAHKNDTIFCTPFTKYWTEFQNYSTVKIRRNIKMFFNVSALLLDDALKPATPTPLINVQWRDQ